VSIPIASAIATATAIAIIIDSGQHTMPGLTTVKYNYGRNKTETLLAQGAIGGAANTQNSRRASVTNIPLQG